jgi:hypothetical protein
VVKGLPLDIIYLIIYRAFFLFDRLFFVAVMVTLITSKKNYREELEEQKVNNKKGQFVASHLSTVTVW